MPINEDKTFSDLESRCLIFAKNVALFYRKLPKDAVNIVNGRQVIRSSGSIGANYIEANEALGPKDFKMRLRICRKEAKESTYWLRLIMETNNTEIIKLESSGLMQESKELRSIFSYILKKSSDPTYSV